MSKAQSFLRPKKEAITPVCVFVEGGKQVQKTSPTKWYWVGSPWRIKETWTNITIHLSSGASGKEPACQCRREKRQGFYPWVGKIPWSRKWQPTPVFLAGKFHGQRSLAGYSQWGHRVRCGWARTEHTSTLGHHGELGDFCFVWSSQREAVGSGVGRWGEWTTWCIRQRNLHWAGEKCEETPFNKAPPCHHFEYT